MRRVLPSFMLVCALLATLEGAQAPAPGPEYKKLEALVGVWRLEGSVKAVPEVGSTDSGHLSCTHVNRMINGGFFLKDGVHWFERLTGTYTRLSSTVPPGS